MTTILYAEDDENDVFFMRRAFTKLGGPQRLIVVPDGRKAVHYVLGREEFADRAAHPKPDFVLLDLKMPVLTGIESLRALREDDANTALPVVLLTSSTQGSDIAEAQRWKANGYFVKPSNATELAGLLKALFARLATAPLGPGERIDIAGNRLPAHR